MKIAHIADIHISDARIQEFETLLLDLGNSIKEQKPDLVVFAGDMFVHRDKLSPKQIELTKRLFSDTLKDFKTIIIPGNHDATMSEEKINSLSAIYIYHKEVDVFDKIGTYIDIDDCRFHMFPYPSKAELTRQNIDDITKIFSDEQLLNSFQFHESKKNVLIYHGTLEGFNMSDSYQASAAAIGIGKDLMIPKSFWKKFDAVLCGHLHRYQAIDKAVYPGCPFPLTFADDEHTGWVLWEDLDPKFIEIEQKFPYITIDIGDLSYYKAQLTDEAVRRIDNDYDYTDGRVRVLYSIASSQTGEVDHSQLSQFFKNAIDIKINPTYIKHEGQASVNFEDFKENSLEHIIDRYIDDRKFHPEVKSIAKIVEKNIKGKYSVEEEKGIHFKLNKLKLSDFKSFGPNQPEIDFNKLDELVGLFGKNKAGKSSLIESIIWALFGQTPRNKDVVTVIRNGQDTCQVDVEFESHTIQYKIERKRSKTGMSLILSKKIDNKWIDISGADNRKTQKFINRLVGSYDMFCATIYSPQNGIDLLVKKKPNERKQIILDCLQVDVLKRRQDEINNIRKDKRDQLITIKGRLSAFSKQYEELVMRRPESLLTEFESLLKSEKINQQRYLNRIETLSKYLYSYEELVSENDKINESLAEFRSSMPELIKKIQRKENEKNRFENVLADKSIVENGLARVEIAEDEVKRYSTELARINSLKNEMEQLEKDKEKLINSFEETSRFLQNSQKTLEDQILGMTSLDCPKADCPLNQKIQEQKDELRIKLDDINEIIRLKQTEKDITCNEIDEKIIRLEKDIDNTFFDKSKHRIAVADVIAEKDNKWEEIKLQLETGEEHLGNMMELIAA